MLRVGSIVIRVDDLERQAEFWAAALDYQRRPVYSDDDSHIHYFFMNAGYLVGPSSTSSIGEFSR